MKRIGTNQNIIGIEVYKCLHDCYFLEPEKWEGYIQHLGKIIDFQADKQGKVTLVKVKYSLEISEKLKNARLPINPIEGWGSANLVVIE